MPFLFSQLRVLVSQFLGHQDIEVMLDGQAISPYGQVPALLENIPAAGHQGRLQGWTTKLLDECRYRAILLSDKLQVIIG